MAAPTDQQLPAQPEPLVTHIRAWANLGDNGRPLIYDMPGTRDEFAALTTLDAAKHNIPAGTVVDLALVDLTAEGDEDDWVLTRKTVTAEHDPADMTWIDNVRLGSKDVATGEQLLEWADQVGELVERINMGLMDRPTPVSVEVLATLVRKLGGQGGARLRQVFDQIQHDAQGWAAIPAGALDPKTGEARGDAMPGALIWTGEHPTEFDLGITDEHPLVVRDGILGWVGGWFVDLGDDWRMIIDRSTRLAGLLRVLEHASAPAAAEDAGEQS